MFGTISNSSNALVVNYLVLCALATYRLAQLIAYDDGPFEIIMNFRRSVKKRANRAWAKPAWTSLVELTECPYCLGVWFAGFTTLIVAILLGMGFWTAILFWWAVAGIQAFLQSLSDARNIP